MSEPSIIDFLNLMNHPSSAEDFNNFYKSFINSLNKSPEFKSELSIHKALSNKLSLEIFKLIQKEDLCNCAIAEILNQKQATIAHHLRKLQDAGLIEGYRKSYFTIYRIKK